MAIFRSISTLISQSRNAYANSSSRTFFCLSLSPSTPTISTFTPSANLFLSHPHFLSRSKCPLFLSSPPWKLSQSATPLLLRADVVVLSFPRVQALSFNLPYDFAFQSVSSPRRIVEEKEFKLSDGSQLAVEVKDSFLNVPNFISFGRMLSGPVIAWMIMHDMYLSAFAGLAISGVSDWLDGYMARKMKIDSVIGSYLDPLADKVLIGFVALAMVDKCLLHSGLVTLVVLRDVALVGGAVYKRASSLDWKWENWSNFFNLDGTRPEKVEPLMLSKVNTVFQLILVAAALLQPEFGSEDTQSYITYLSWLVAITTIGSTVAYGMQHLKTGSLTVTRR